MTVFAIDPGTTESAWAVVEAGEFVSGAKERNEDMLERAWGLCPPVTHVAVEKVASYGMAVGAEVFETVYWSGRFHEAARYNYMNLSRPTRKEVVVHLCGSAKAKDANVRQAIIDRLGPQGTKKNPGPTYGVKGDVWAAIAVALYTYDKLMEEQK